MYIGHLIQVTVRMLYVKLRKAGSNSDPVWWCGKSHSYKLRANLKLRGIPNERTRAPPQNLISSSWCLHMTFAHKCGRWGEPLRYTGRGQGWIPDRQISHFVDAQRQHCSVSHPGIILHSKRFFLNTRFIHQIRLWCTKTVLHIARNHVFVAKVSSFC